MFIFFSQYFYFFTIRYIFIQVSGFYTELKAIGYVHKPKLFVAFLGLK